ncbi:hypothetical protein [Microbacterium phage MO526]|uniref:Lysin A n=1 Tax=Microbacterium phage MO526 TaxID=3108092 RepID=A0ABZ0ZXD1_9CAUD|nr:hypothetical protein [Microbacterium phage MO526]
MADYVYRDGQRLTAWMFYVITLLNRDLLAAFGVHVIVTSAIRTYEEQKRIFLERYVTAGNVRGRRVYDTRWWNGVLWYRISAAGTVAVPGSSNHEIQGQKAAVDIRDSGADAGITVASSVRGRWIRDWCRRTGLLIASGDGFREGWHFDVPGIFRTPPASPAGAPGKPVNTSEEDNIMLMLRIKAGPGTHLCALGEGIFRHFVGTDPYEKIKNVSRSADDWQDIDITELPAFLRTYGCDLNIWDFRDPKTGKSVAMNAPGAAFMVLDPLTNQVGSGHMWSASGAARRATSEAADRIEKAVAALAKPSGS